MRSGGNRTKLVVGVAVALVAIVGGLIAAQSFRADEPVSETAEAAPGTEPTLVQSEPASISPAAAGTGWHALMGVWDCTLASGQGDWHVPWRSEPFVAMLEAENTIAPSIRTFSDNLVHINPALMTKSGELPTLGALIERAEGVAITDGRLEVPVDRVLASGPICEEGPAVLHVRRWPNADAATNGEAPQLITDGLSNLIFTDGEVWTIALAPLASDVPLPPVERVAALASARGEQPDATPNFVLSDQPAARIAMVSHNGADMQGSGVAFIEDDGSILVRMLVGHPQDHLQFNLRADEMDDHMAIPTGGRIPARVIGLDAVADDYVVSDRRSFFAVQSLAGTGDDSQSERIWVTGGFDVHSHDYSGQPHRFTGTFMIEASEGSEWNCDWTGERVADCGFLPED